MALPSNPNLGRGLPQRPVGPPQSNQPPQESAMPDLSGDSLRSDPSEQIRQLRERVAEQRPEFAREAGERHQEYDFGSQGLPQAQRELSRQTPELEDDEPFSSIEPSRAFDEEDEEPQPIQRITNRPVPEPIEEPEPEQAPVRSKKRSRKPDKPQAGELDAKGQNLHIDRKSKKLTPFGGKKSLKVSDFDKRKDTRSKARLVQTVMLVGLILVVLIGAYNAIVPKKTLTANDVRATVQETVQQTDFPIEGGEGFATDFIQAYLTLGDDPTSSEVLNYYYTGRMVSGEESFPNRQNGQGYSQKLLYGPTIYGKQYLTDSSANYTVGALVQPEDKSGGKTSDSDDTSDSTTDSTDEDTAPVDKSTAKWQFFSVNVYYDAKTQQYSVTPDSPTLMPTPANLPSSKVPDATPLGTGDEIEDQDVVKSAVQGFMEGYRTSTSEDHIRIDPYVIKDAGPDLLTGLGGVYEFSNGVDNAVTYTAFKTDNSEIKVLIKVAWEYKFTNTVNTTYSSQYVMTLEPASGKYLVSKFAPYYYVAGDE